MSTDTGFAWPGAAIVSRPVVVPPVSVGDDTNQLCCREIYFAWRENRPATAGLPCRALLCGTYADCRFGRDLPG